MLSDLEADFINPYDASSRINYIIVPEFIGQGLLCAFCLLTGHWIMFLMTIPVTCYHVMLYMKQQHLIDVTEVFQALDSEKKFRIAKLAYYLTIIIITVFRDIHDMDVLPIGLSTIPNLDPGYPVLSAYISPLSCL
ncbi:unnamed protein product [Sphenostylis stenocarpa]|uniref:Uncharacterized protein n=1 Tax=Sphenostylis stenocarpa TaxID=92480 RepID=A0AA86S030_9FABA|nr:unnamed protein product [Sphenostylis stenocarpa]